jgi:hypothetical protein
LDNNSLRELSFQGTFTKHQEMILDRFEQRRKEKAASRFKLHLVSPPGSGKTIMGLEMAVRIGKPALVVCPNTAIQGQWVQKFDMFYGKGLTPGKEPWISVDPEHLGLVNVFTYQMLSVPVSEDESFSRVSENIWAQNICDAIGIPLEEALARICRIKENNPEAYRSEIAKINKALRKQYIQDPECTLSQILHPNTIMLIKKLKSQKVGTVVFDECHHLQSYWALAMREIIAETRATSVIGLTATPPLDEDMERLECYKALMGEVDYEIPTPAVVKEGMLAPYQDLVRFCVPAEKEMQYISACHQQFKEFVARYDAPGSDFYYWIHDRIVKRKLLTAETQEWSKFVHSRPGFATAGVKYLLKHGCSLPWDITISECMYEEITLKDWIYLIEDYALNLLKVSPRDDDRQEYGMLRSALRNLGYLLTEKGIRSHRSPLDRVLGYSRSKLAAVRDILVREAECLGDKIRAAIVTDFEISGSLSLKSPDSVMDDECGGAASVMKELVSYPDTDHLDPVMITARNLICDDDSADIFIKKGLEWAGENGFEITLACEPVPFGKFVGITGSGRDWNSKTALLLVTALFESGITKCIVGTRGLLGEGWDSVSLNTLIDLTAVTTFASVNQLRGRSIRKNPRDPGKVSNNWDVICVAPGLEKGYQDYDRLIRKHEQYYGICDDGQIQRGIEHVDPHIIPGEGFLSLEDIHKINARMFETGIDRQRTRTLWKVGEPYDNMELGCCELKLRIPMKMKPGSVLVNERKRLRRMLVQNITRTMVASLSLAGGVFGALAMSPAIIPLFGLAAIMAFRTGTGIRNFWRYGKENFLKIAVRKALEDIAKVLLFSLVDCGLLPKEITVDRIVMTERADGTTRIYLDQYETYSDLFSASFGELFMPIENQRYGIPRYEVPIKEEGLNKVFCLFRYSIGREQSYIACYHPLPSVFDVKEKALIFQKYWNRFVSPGDVVFLKGVNGRKIVEKYGRKSISGASRRNLKVWR